MIFYCHITAFNHDLYIIIVVSERVSEWMSVCVNYDETNRISRTKSSRAKEVKKSTQRLCLESWKVIGEQMLLCFRVHKEASLARLRTTLSRSHHTHNNNPNEMKKYGRKMQ